jgi:Golgi phosphoprotein 3
MMNPRRLRLFEEMLLLELDDDKGTTRADCWHKTEMGGAILAELVLSGAITITDDKKKQVKLVPGAARPEDLILAEALALIQESKKIRKASDWVQKFAALKDLKNRAARQLVAKGVLKEDTGKVLGIFKRTIYPEANPGPEQDLRRRLEEAIFMDQQEVDPATTVVVALARATGLLDRVFTKKRLKPRKQRLEDLVNGNLAGKATREAVEAVQAAILVATIVPAIAASTTAATSG